MYFSNVMVATAIFYGIQQSTVYEDIAASFCISLISTMPIFMIRRLFKKSRPKIQRTSRQTDPTADALYQNAIANGGDIDADSPSSASAGNAVYEIQSDSEGIASQETETDDIATDLTSLGTTRSQRVELTNLYEDAVQMNTFGKRVQQMYHEKEDQQDMKIRAVQDIRRVIFESMYPYPRWMKAVGWIILIIWCITTCIIAIVYGLSFDIDMTSEVNTENVNYEFYSNESCWNRSVYLEIEDTLSRQWVESEMESWNLLNAGSYGGSDSVSWIISVFQALAASLILWQPLTIAMTTWIKLWMFTWNLRMDIGPSNLMALYKRCCGHDSGEEELSPESPSVSTRPRKSRKRQTRTEKELDGAVKRLTVIMNRISESHTEPMVSWNEHRSSAICGASRPLDVMSFLTNSNWIIDDLTRDVHLERYSDAKVCV